MKPSLFDQYRPHPEPSTMVAFAENTLDRQSEHCKPIDGGGVRCMLF